MSEMRTISCPSCETANQPLAAVDGMQEYRCHTCGLVYYGPCGCDTTHAVAAEARVTSEAGSTSGPTGGCVIAVGDDWQTTTPPVEARDKAAVQAYPGC
jgi:hypothetical protein